MAALDNLPQVGGGSTSAMRTMNNMGNLPVWRQAGLFVGLAASIALGVSVVMWSWKPSLSVLYTGLSEKDASLVLEALNANNTQFELEGVGTIMVPSSEVHELRIKLAAEGIPRGTALGFESLQDAPGFGVSQFMETARYQRALEVELSRSISALHNVESARVHLALPKQSTFLRNRKKASASVLLNLYSGRSLEKSHVAAIAHLVSSSIPDVSVDQVTVVDQRGNLLTEGKQDQQMVISRTQLEYTQQLETGYAKRIVDILDPIVGNNATRAQVTADVDFTSTEQTQELYNPESQTVRSSQLSEEASPSGTAGGIPGALSNEPPGAGVAPEQAAAGVTASAGANLPLNGKRRSIQNFEIDRTISHTRYSVGTLKRLSVAVVIDDKNFVDAGGDNDRRAYTPEELDRITGLVKEAVGFNVERGDSVSVVNAAFTSPVEAEEIIITEAGFWEAPAFWDQIIKVLGTGLAFFLVWMVLRPVLKSLSQEPRPQALATGASSMPMTPSSTMPGHAALTGGMADDKINLDKQTADELIKAAGSQADIAKHVAKSEPGVVAQVIKSWVAEDSK